MFHPEPPIPQKFPNYNVQNQFPNKYPSNQNFRKSSKTNLKKLSQRTKIDLEIANQFIAPLRPIREHDHSNSLN